MRGILILSLLLVLLTTSVETEEVAITPTGKTTELIYFHMEGRTNSCPTVCESYTDINEMYGTMVTRKDCYLSEMVDGYCTVIIPMETKPKRRHDEDYFNTLLKGSMQFAKPSV